MACCCVFKKPVVVGEIGWESRSGVEELVATGVHKAAPSRAATLSKKKVEITLMWEMQKENTFLAFSPVETLVGRGEQEEGEGDLEQEETPPRFLA
jgi:hypothetical protein